MGPTAIARKLNISRASVSAARVDFGLNPARKTVMPTTNSKNAKKSDTGDPTSPQWAFPMFGVIALLLLFVFLWNTG